MPIAFDPITYLNRLKQQEATTGRKYTTDDLVQMGYGTSMAAIQRDVEGQKLALASQAESARESIASRGMSLQEKQYKGAMVGQMAALPLNIAMLNKYTENKAGEGYIERGYGAAKEWLGGGSPTGATAYDPGSMDAATLTGGAGTATYESASTGGGLGMGGATSEGTMAAGEMGAGMSAYAGPAAGAGVAGYVGGKYGPDLGSSKVSTLGMGGQKEQKVGGGMIRGAGAGAASGAAIGAMFGGVGAGPGAIIGAIVGGVAGGASQTVICTELRDQGFVTQDLLDLEAGYRPKIDWETYWGYRLWADPVVRLMKKSRGFSKLMSIPGKAFLKEVAHRVDPERPANFFGKLLLTFGVPFCRWNLRRFQRKFVRFHARYVQMREVANG